MTSLAQTLKQYFDIAIETDPALKEVYDEKKLDECGKYINNRARKLASNNMAMVESSVVFKWARDFFYGDMEDENAKPEIDKGADKRIKDEIEVEARDATVIKQFYADERSGTPNGSRPTADVIESFNKWLSDKPDLIEFTKAKRKSKKTELAEVA